MLDTVRLYIDATVAVATMATLGFIAGLVAYGITGDGTLIILAAIAVFALTGAVLMIRLWRTNRKPALPLDPGV